MSPAVTVIIPVYNRAETIVRAIRSVQNQSFTDWELLVIDDASSDNTANVVEGLGDSRIRILRQAMNRGPSAARQIGLQAAKGEYVALLDSDDEWLPEKLAKQLESKSRVVTCGYIVRQRGEEWTFIHPPVINWVEHLHYRSLLCAGSTLLTRRDCALQIGGFDTELRYCEDWDFALRLAEANPINVLAKPLARIYVGTGRSMIAAEPSIRRFLRKHDAAFRQIGQRHRRRVRGQHLQNLAAGAFANRRFGVGAKWLIESFLTNPLQNPIRLAALGIAPIDALFGTSLIENAAARMRRSIERNTPKPAP